MPRPKNDTLVKSQGSDDKVKSFSGTEKRINTNEWGVHTGTLQ